GRVTYEKLPYGDDYGIANADSTGKFETMMLSKNQYSFIVRAEGFVIYRETLSFKENTNGDSSSIQKDFFLSPGGVGHVIRIKNLYFEQSTSDIPKSALQELNDIVEMLNENAEMVIQLEGHTDFRGNPKLNYQLSEERVEAIRDYIYDKGIDKRRVKVKAFGGSMPLSKEDSEEAKKTNRRVEIRVLEI
ncbi:MAG TPA: OmpA family protein, partial [Cytophagales bacterium]|nr:OmpA family protein [Cytophagales bacterium]